MENKEIFYSESDNPKMIAAFKKARETFKYFWREFSWEPRRIVPGLDLASVKIAFSQEFDGEEKPFFEHMWITDPYFDGDIIYGTLLNTPSVLTNVQNGDYVQVPLSQVSDWLFAIEGKTYGGFSIQAMRSEMDADELKEHDSVWGLDFGDFNEVLIVRDEKEKPENLIEHPMSINMKESFINFIKNNPDEVNTKDDFGYTLLHREAIAGNKTLVEILIESGAKVDERTKNGKTALDFARDLNWQHIVAELEKASTLYS